MTTTHTYEDECRQCEALFTLDKRPHPMNDTGLCPSCEADYEPSEEALSAFYNDHAFIRPETPREAAARLDRERAPWFGPIGR